jgi:hypothetical protein
MLVDERLDRHEWLCRSHRMLVLRVRGIGGNNASRAQTATKAVVSLAVHLGSEGSGGSSDIRGALATRSCAACADNWHPSG